MSEFEDFWNRRASRKRASKNIANLEDDDCLYQLKVKHEVEQVDKFFLMSKKNGKLLDLGAGEGFWSRYFSSRCKEIIAVDFSQNMLKHAKNNGDFSNIRYLKGSAEKYTSVDVYDIIFISGLIIYLEDESLDLMIRNIDSYTSKGSVVLLRDGTAVNERYEIRGQYSESLQDSYSAIYRSKEEYIEAFNKAGFRLWADEQMFPEGHALNKFPETRLRLYLFFKERQ